MVRCLDCLNLVKAFFPTTSPDSLFDEKWRCKVTGQVFEMHYLVEKERECLQCKRPSMSEKRGSRLDRISIFSLS